MPADAEAAGGYAKELGEDRAALQRRLLLETVPRIALKAMLNRGMQVDLGGFGEDKAEGDVLGQGVNDVWYVVRPDGEMVTDPAPGASSGMSEASSSE